MRSETIKPNKFPIWAANHLASCLLPRNQLYSPSLVPPFWAPQPIFGLISLASGWVLDEPQANNSAPEKLILSFVLFRPEWSLFILFHASNTVFSQSSHNNHDSSNLKAQVSLLWILQSDLVCRTSGWWSEAWEKRWIIVFAGNFSLHPSLATVRFSLSLVFASLGLLLFHVYG